jgi:hypothetical protein
MPFGDGTGPRGMGPMTGRGAGYCAGYNQPGYSGAIPARRWPSLGFNWRRNPDCRCLQPFGYSSFRQGRLPLPRRWRRYSWTSF